METIQTQTTKRDAGESLHFLRSEISSRSRKAGRLAKDDWAAWMDEEIKHDELLNRFS